MGKLYKQLESLAKKERIIINNKGIENIDNIVKQKKKILNLLIKKYKNIINTPKSTYILISLLNMLDRPDNLFCYERIDNLMEKGMPI